MNEMGFVNFEDEIIPEIEETRNRAIATLMRISIDELNDEYQIVSLRPLTEIVANKFQDEIKKSRIYTISELVNEARIFQADFYKFRCAKEILQFRTQFTGEYAKSLKEIDQRFLEFISKTDVTLHPTSLGPFVNWGLSHYIEIIAVIPNSSKLARKQFEMMSEKEYDDLYQYLAENNLITLRSD